MTQGKWVSSMIARSELHWLEETSLFFEKKGPVWDALRSLVLHLDKASVDYVVIGGLALNFRNYQRQTTDVNIVLTRSGFDDCTRVLEGAAAVSLRAQPHRVRCGIGAGRVR